MDNINLSKSVEETSANSEKRDDTAKDKEGLSLKLSAIEILKDVAFVLVFLFIINYVISLHKIVGVSMSPTVSDGMILVANRSKSNLERFDIIVTEPMNIDNSGEPKPIIKRVIALPGETVEIINGNTYINGELLIEPYKVESLDSMELISVPEGFIFAMGDNRPYSLDSRELGPISVDNVRGKALLVFGFKVLS